MNQTRLMIGFGPGITPTVRNLIIINIALYVLKLLAAFIPIWNSFLSTLALQPAAIFHRFAIWQILSYMFLHGNFFHIFFNLFTLWMFGCEVERYLGSRGFLRFYLLSGIGAACMHLLINSSSSTPVIGASGAIYGVLIAFAVLFPDRTITLLLFFVLPIQIKAKYLVSIFLLISIFSGIESQIFGVSDGIAHLAHLGGAFTGYVLIRGRSLFSLWLLEIRKKWAWRRMAAQKRKQRILQEKQQEIDRILDRINAVGFENISEKEKEILKKASRYLSKK